MRPDRNRSNLVEFVCRFVPASVRFGHEQQTKNARPRLDIRRREDPRRYRLPRSPLGSRGQTIRFRRRTSFPFTLPGRGRRPIKAGSETGAETVGQDPQAPTGLEARSSEIVGLGSVLIKLDLPSVPKSVLLATSSFCVYTVAERWTTTNRAILPESVCFFSSPFSGLRGSRFSRSFTSRAVYIADDYKNQHSAVSSAIRNAAWSSSWSNAVLQHGMGTHAAGI